MPVTMRKLYNKNGELSAYGLSLGYGCEKSEDGVWAHLSRTPFYDNIYDLRIGTERPNPDFPDDKIRTFRMSICFDKLRHARRAYRIAKQLLAMDALVPGSVYEYVSTWK